MRKLKIYLSQKWVWFKNYTSSAAVGSLVLSHFIFLNTSAITIFTTDFYAGKLMQPLQDLREYNLHSCLDKFAYRTRDTIICTNGWCETFVHNETACITSSRKLIVSSKGFSSLHSGECPVPQDSILETWTSRHLTFESWGSNLENHVSSLNLLLSCTVQKLWKKVIKQVQITWQQNLILMQV